MDSNDLERERGITILAKATSVVWKDMRVNIVDTPGHADFGGEVERILSMVDGAIVLVDAAEGPMPQTKFVVGKALKIGLKPIVCVNKVDKPDARPSEVVNECFDLFAALDATDEQLDFPIIYGSAKQGWMAEFARRPEGEHGAAVRPGAQARRAAEGRRRRLPHARHPARGQSLSRPHRHRPHLLRLDQDQRAGQGARPRSAISSRPAGCRRSSPSAASSARRSTRRSAGDIVAIAGLEKFNVADTLCSPEEVEPLQAQPIDPPTLSMTFSVNDSPLAGTEGDKVTSRVIRDRLFKEAEGNVALQRRAGAELRRLRRLRARRIAARHPDRDDAARGLRARRVAAQGAHHARRDDGELLEPIEEVVIDVDEEHSGVVVQKMSERKGEMIEMRPSGGDRLRLVFLAPTRGLIGYLGELLTDTRGTAIMNRVFHNWGAWQAARSPAGATAC